MAVSESSCLLDTNILLRLAKRDSPEFASIREALWILDGHGLSIKEADKAAQHIESAFHLLPYAEQIHAEWRRLTLNDRDFIRYKEVVPLHPRQVVSQR
jgi:hypothetical protein